MDSIIKTKNNYSLGKIYKITSPNCDEVYIGSTTQTLNIRFSEHKSRCITENRNSKIVIDKGDAVIELIEDFPCESKKELFRREGEIMKATLNCCNKYIAGRTKQEWVAENSVHVKEYHKQYQIDNIIEIKQTNKKYREDNDIEIKEKKKEYYDKNSEQLYENRKEYIAKNIDKVKIQRQTSGVKFRELHKEIINEHFECYCGGAYSYSTKARHFKTNKHLSFINPISDEVEVYNE